MLYIWLCLDNNNSLCIDYPVECCKITASLLGLIMVTLKGHWRGLSSQNRGMATPFSIVCSLLLKDLSFHVGWRWIFSSVAWLTGVPMDFLFCSGCSVILFDTQGSPVDGQLVELRVLGFYSSVFI